MAPPQTWIRRTPPGNSAMPQGREVPESGAAGGFGVLALILRSLTLPFTRSPICPQCHLLISGINDNFPTHYNCCLSVAPTLRTGPQQGPFSRFLFSKLASLFRHLQHFYPSKPGVPLSPGSHPSFVLGTGLAPAALEKSAVDIPASGDPGFHISGCSKVRY